MRKKMLFLALGLAALAASTTVRAEGGYHSCPDCTVYPNGSQCCVSCICDSQGIRVACTNVICPPAGGGEHD